MDVSILHDNVQRSDYALNFKSFICTSTILQEQN